jgi:hypothetical protein
MTRVLEFKDSDEGNRRFQLIWDGFRMGSMSQKPEERTPEVMRTEGLVRKALKAISTNGAQENDIDHRDLQTGGGTVELEQPQVKLLTKYGWAVQWRPHVLEDAIDALDFVDSAPEADHG